MVNLKVEDVNFDVNPVQIRVPPNIPGNRIRIGYFALITPEAADLLVEYLEYRRETLGHPVGQDSPLIANYKKDEKSITTKSLRASWISLLRRAPSVRRFPFGAVSLQAQDPPTWLYLVMIQLSITLAEGCSKRSAWVWTLSAVMSRHAPYHWREPSSLRMTRACSRIQRTLPLFWMIRYS